MRCLTILLDFWPRFRAKINANSFLELNMSKNGKPSKTLRGQAKIKVLPPRNEQKNAKSYQNRCGQKKRQKVVEFFGLRSVWGSFGEPKTRDLRTFCEVFRSDPKTGLQLPCASPQTKPRRRGAEVFDCLPGLSKY